MVVCITPYHRGYIYGKSLNNPVKYSFGLDLWNRIYGTFNFGCWFNLPLGWYSSVVFAYVAASVAADGAWGLEDDRPLRFRSLPRRTFLVVSNGGTGRSVVLHGLRVGPQGGAACLLPARTGRLGLPPLPPRRQAPPGRPARQPLTRLGRARVPHPLHRQARHGQWRWWRRLRCCRRAWMTGWTAGVPWTRATRSCRPSSPGPPPCRRSTCTTACRSRSCTAMGSWSQERRRGCPWGWRSFPTQPWCCRLQIHMVSTPSLSGLIQIQSLFGLLWFVIANKILDAVVN